MRKLLPGVLCLMAVISTPALCQQFVFKINPDSARRAISPFIYGTNQDYDHAGSKRLGGNRLTGYNWENNASNAGTDWLNESDDYEISDQGVPPADAQTPGSVIRYFHNKSLAMKAYSLVTLPLAGYVAKDMNGQVSQAEAAPSTRWAKVYVRKNSPLSLQPNLLDDSVFVDEEVSFLLSRFGTSQGSSGIRGYALDNEPDIWNSTHPLLFGSQPLRTDTLLNRSIAMANMVKDLDAGAEVFGWASYGFNGYLNLQSAPDWDLVKGNNSTFLEYYLERMKAEHLKTGRRLLDVLDLHWYPETDLTLHVSPFDDKTDYQSNALRMNMVRSLWDSTYTENTWIGQQYHDYILPLLPKAGQYIAQHYPGTKLAITEYSYMGMNHASGGIAQADALGVFGKNGLYLATYWGYVQKYIKAGFDLYRNYDGNAGSFGTTSIGASANDYQHSSVYAAVDSSDNSKLHVVALNKDQDSSHIAVISVAGNVQYKSARVFMFDNSGYEIRQVNNIRKIDSNTFQVLLPPLSAYHFVLTTEDLSIYPYIDTLSLNTPAGYADGKTTLHVEASVSDGDHNISSVAIDLSALGGSGTQAFLQKDSKYVLDYVLPAGLSAGLKTLPFTVSDSDQHVARKNLVFRVIAPVPALKLWDGDTIRAGEAYKFYDDADSKIPQMKMQVVSTGGNQGPVNLYMHMIHDVDKWNLFAWRFAPNPLKTDDVSNYAFLEFYIRSNAPENSDIDVSIQDASDQQNNSAVISLKGNGYISAFNSSSFTRVRIPFSQLTAGINFDLTKLWQINFHTNSASRGFDVWVDDIRAIPYPLPASTPLISNASVTPSAGYADGFSSLTLNAYASDPDNNLKGVYADLSSLGGKNNQPLRFDGQKFGYSFSIPAGLVKGPKNILLYALDSTGFEMDTTLNFQVYRKATTDTIWNGDRIKNGSAWVSNIKTTCGLKTPGGNYGPGVLKLHLQAYSPDTWSGISWDWNAKSNNSNIQDLREKRYLSFYIKVSNAPKSFDPEIMLKDMSANESISVALKKGGYLSGFTGQYQLVNIPLADLFTHASVDPASVTNLVITAATLPPAGVDVYVDDITASGSTLADVRMSEKDAACGANGRITVDTVIASSGNYRYLINGSKNPAGDSIPSFANLVPGVYDIKVTGNNGFVYLQSVTVRGNAGINVTPRIVNGTDVYLTVTGGSGKYGYAWSTGQTTQNVSGLGAGTYTVQVADSVTGCKSSNTVTLGGSQPIVKAKLGARETGTPTVSLYPNPARDQIMLTHNLDGVKWIDLYNPAGQLIKRFYPQAPVVKLDIQGLQNGLYLLKLNYDNGLYTASFLKQ